jgi:hypothetical protein
MSSFSIVEVFRSPGDGRGGGTGILDGPGDHDLSGETMSSAPAAGLLDNTGGERRRSSDAHHPQ